MPSHPFHLNVDLIMLGTQFRDVHATLDVYAAEMGPNHRKYLHDDGAVSFIYFSFESHMAAWSAFYHIVLDRVSDRVSSDSCIAEFLFLRDQGVIPEYDCGNAPPSLLDTY